MTEPTPENIEKLLEELSNRAAHRRKAAAKALGELGIRTEEIVEALKTVASQDPERYVRLAAKGALSTLEHGPVERPAGEPPPAASPSPKLIRQLSRNEKIRDFLIGFVGWFVLNGFLTGIGWAVTVGLGTLLSRLSFNSDSAQTLLGAVGLVVNCLPWLINIGLLIYFGLTRYWIALGALAAFGAVLFLLLCVAVVVWVMCFAGLSSFGGGP